MVRNVDKNGFCAKQFWWLTFYESSADCSRFRQELQATEDWGRETKSQSENKCQMKYTQNDLHVFKRGEKMISMPCNFWLE
jgi:hypothetical protein